jgi:hypothetical protein
MAGVDVVAISVPTSQNATVLRQLVNHADQLDIVIDTPIAWSGAEHAEIAPLLARFKRVTVTEDYMNFPRFALVRETVRRGVIGELRSVTLTNIGYLYHGLALIRSFVGFDRAKTAWSRKIGASVSVVGYEFDGGFSAAVVGPYRRHVTGGILVEGSRGIITEFPIDRDFVAHGRQTYVMSRTTHDGHLSGFAIQGGGHEASIDLPFMRQMRAMNFPDKSDLNLERGCGLIEVFRVLIDFRNLNSGYSAEEACYDSFASRRAESEERPLDPFAQSSVRTWTAKAETFLKATVAPASSLPLDKKIRVWAGARIEASSVVHRHEGHLSLLSASLDGRPVPAGNWLIFEQHLTAA